MPITVAEGTRVLRAYGVQAHGVTREPIFRKTHLTQFGKDVHMARRAIEALPEVREDRIAAVRKKLAEGKGLSCDAIAEKIIFQATADSLR